MRSKYLPTKEELEPITNNNSTFYDCNFNVSFDQLSFEKKLQVLTDIVRQSMKGVKYPDPNTDKLTMCGNCHTSALVLSDYLKELSVGKNIRYVMCKKRPYDPSDLPSRHAALLVDDDFGVTYYVDPTAFVGYKYGVVQKLSSDIAYEEYEVMDNEKLEILYHLKNFLYKCSSNLIKNEELNFYKDIINCALEYPIFDGFITHCLYFMGSVQDNTYDRDKYFMFAKKINPYFEIEQNDPKNLQRNYLILNQICKWKEELKDISDSANIDYKRQLELATNIFQELKMMDNTLNTKILFEGKPKSVSHLTPRMFLDEGLNMAMIKPSSYQAGVSATVREAFLNKGNGAVYEYQANLAEPTMTGIVPIVFSHTVGYQNKRAYQGLSDIILLKRPAKEIYAIKKKIRSELGKNLYNKEVMWNDGEKILWHPFLLNFAHTADNPSEACLHFLIGKPEEQLMTRFMYPNPKLTKLDNEKYL